MNWVKLNPQLYFTYREMVVCQTTSSLSQPQIFQTYGVNVICGLQIIKRLLTPVQKIKRQLNLTPHIMSTLQIS
jgi:hypothetical protein